MAEHWGGRPEAYKGTAITGCPNLFTISGPNGSTASVFAGIEATCGYIGEALRTARDRRLRTLEVRPETARAWKRAANARLARTMHSAGGCTNQYTDIDNNNVTLFPATMTGMGRALRTFDLPAYEARTWPDESEPVASRAPGAEV